MINTKFLQQLHKRFRPTEAYHVQPLFQCKRLVSDILKAKTALIRVAMQQNYTEISATRIYYLWISDMYEMPIFVILLAECRLLCHFANKGVCYLRIQKKASFVAYHLYDAKKLWIQTNAKRLTSIYHRQTKTIIIGHQCISD